MKYKGNRRFKKMSEKMWYGASKGLLAGIMIFGANTTFAQVGADYTPLYEYDSGKVSGMHIMHRFNSLPKINALANQLGIDSNAIKEGLKSGKTLKQILQEYGITMDEIHRAYSGG